MEFITTFGTNLGAGLTTLLAFVVVLTVIVFIHELGHFQVARWCGVAVKTFSIGFGKELYGWNDRHGTHWRIAAIPLGGYVQFIDDRNPASASAGPSGDDNETLTDEQRKGSFHLKPLWIRAAVVAAGPIYNFILAIAIFSGLFMLQGRTIMEARIAEVQPGTPAAAAGFEADDVILNIDGTEIEGFSDLQRIVSSRVGQELTFIVDRKGTELTLKATPELRELNDELAGKHRRPVIGIKASRANSKMTHIPVSPLAAIGLGAERTWNTAIGTLSYIGDVISGRQGAEQIGGPVRIADVAGKIAKKDWTFLINFTAFISVSIGLLNLFPIPILDGGHLMFYAIEAIRGKPLSENVQEYCFRIGLALILMLMFLGLWNDRGILMGWLSWTS